MEIKKDKLYLSESLSGTSITPDDIRSALSEYLGGDFSPDQLPEKDTFVYSRNTKFAFQVWYATNDDDYLMVDIFPWKEPAKPDWNNGVGSAMAPIYR